jgi:hypothetical protein
MNIQVKGTTLVIEVDISDAALKSAPMSSSGKSRVVATTHGFTSIAGKVRVGVNVITS